MSLFIYRKILQIFCHAIIFYIITKHDKKRIYALNDYTYTRKYARILRNYYTQIRKRNIIRTGNTFCTFDLTY